MHRRKWPTFDLGLCRCGVMMMKQTKMKMGSGVVRLRKIRETDIVIAESEEETNGMAE